MEALDVAFAKQMAVIIEQHKRTNNFTTLKGNILTLVRKDRYKEYFDYIKLDKVVIKRLSSLDHIINIFFIGTIVPEFRVNEPSAITRILFDNPKYLEYNRIKLINYVAS